jgi:predicted metal-dependent hydrolase
LSIQPFKLGAVTVDLVRKDIKNVHLSVHPPTGRVRIAAPRSMDTETVRLFAVAKIEWIRKQQLKLVGQDRESPRDFLDRETHYLWGRRYLLRVVSDGGARRVEPTHSTLVVYSHAGDTADHHAATMSRFYRQQVRTEAAAMVEQWSKRLAVEVRTVHVRRMRTRWGSCSPVARTIRLNTELAKKPRECLEYVVVHELAHMLDPTHGKRFVTVLTRHMPQWRTIRSQLNALPLRHEEWSEQLEAGAASSGVPK